jgi:hypothetical protein
MVSSWLAVADRSVADDVGLLPDVPIRRTHVPELLVGMLQRRAQGRASVNGKN